jgi:hemolysin activation/secretion protein
MLPNSVASTAAFITMIPGLITFSLSGVSTPVKAMEVVESASVSEKQQGALSSFSALFPGSNVPVKLAQTLPLDVPRDLPGQILPRDLNIPEPTPLPDTLPPPLPPPDQLLQPTEPALVTPELSPDEASQTVFVEQFRVEGSTVFNVEELADLAWQGALLDSDEGISTLIQSYCSRDAATADTSDASQETADPTPSDAGESSLPLAETASSEASVPAATIPEMGRELSFTQLLRARTVITQLYIQCGYITSGAILPPQTPAEQDNFVVIQVVEGSLEDIDVTGLRRLNPGYVGSRLAIAGSTPVNQQDLLEGLQLLQLNPLIQRISADLQAGTRPGTSILQVEAIEADTFDITLDLNNNRSPQCGQFSTGNYG